MIKQRISEKESALRYMNSLSNQKEISWSIMGGIADGIAGPAAGVAVAMDIQAQNAAIRAQNAANAQLLAPAKFSTYQNISDLNKAYDRYEKELDDTKTKLVSDMGAKECLECIVFNSTDVKVSASGTCTVVTKAKLPKQLIIFDDLKAVIDGTIIAEVYDGSNKIADVPIVLPKYGIGDKEELELMGMALCEAEQDKKYIVKYTATNLWAMEK